ncbi:alpha/beta-hydrolase [Suhomyces tanzawaensis NRRL Y-17324]|uniref:Alpha/beta-hydrolase n=1 Tax=Suhomyces tanzawaensis NRRL Y-17324 TaxID=984487 RepID=A0A1E4SRL3_9ASCO|nr:alpha/beta-hydrolase [Suhomyces tanzawaensis NRRL Y-17324]ODV82141.1 alpha/beta-hydrolase [Suhomyces tanzawaensis NRRL Y-17324]
MSYTVETKTIDAAFPRSPGSTLLVGEKLKLVYNRYKNTQTAPAGAIRYNFVFSHGTGMNKSVWKYHIHQLYQRSGAQFYVDSVVSIDAAGHGDSALLNANNLGWVCNWGDHGKDINAVVKYEQNTTGDFQNGLESRTIAIGHSFGGHGVILAAFYEPDLYDSIVPIEPVVYGTPESVAKFSKIFSKLSNLLLDDFDSLDDFNDYFTKFSIFKTLDKRVLADFMKDELHVEKDKEGETHYKTKASNFAQMTCYFGSAVSIPFCMEIQHLIRVPVHHVTGKKATWNLPEGAPFFRSHVQERFISSFDLEEGQHMMNVERPDETVEIIVDYVLKRQEDFKKERETLQEVKYQGDKHKIKETQFDLLKRGDLLSLSGAEKLTVPANALAKL